MSLFVRDYLHPVRETGALIPIVFAAQLSHHISKREDGSKYQLRIVLCAESLTGCRRRSVEGRCVRSWSQRFGRARNWSR